MVDHRSALPRKVIQNRGRRCWAPRHAHLNFIASDLRTLRWRIKISAAAIATKDAEATGAASDFRVNYLGHFLCGLDCDLGHFFVSTPVSGEAPGRHKIWIPNLVPV